MRSSIDPSPPPTLNTQDVKYWRLDTGRCFKTLSGHTERVCALRFDQQILATASQDLTVRYVL
jgi:WD40 repeat protein